MGYRTPLSFFLEESDEFAHSRLGQVNMSVYWRSYEGKEEYTKKGKAAATAHMAVCEL